MQRLRNLYVNHFQFARLNIFEKDGTVQNIFTSMGYDEIAGGIF